MTSLQKVICLVCVIVAAAAAVTAGVVLAPQGDEAPPASDHATVPAKSEPAPAPTQAQAPVAKPAPSAAPSAQAQTPSSPPAPTPANTQATPPQAPTPSAPRVDIQPKIFDFGTKNPNDLVWTQFTIKNPTKQTLFVREVKPACKCTVPTLDSNVIPPGGEIHLKASVDLRGHLGSVRKNFNVFFEGYGQPIEGIIEGTLSYPVQVTPDSPRFNSLQTDLTGQLTLRSIEDRPFRVCAINGQEPKVLFKNSPGESATEWRVQYTIDAASLADVPCMLLVETDHPGAEMLDIKFAGAPLSQRELEWIKLWKDIFVNRSNVNLGAIPKGGYADFQTSVVRPDHTNPCTISFDSTMFDIKPTPLAAKPGELSIEIVKIEPVDGRPSDEMYTVRVTNNSDENKVIQMPLYFHSGDVESRTWIGARLVPKAGDQPCAVSSN